MATKIYLVTREVQETKKRYKSTLIGFVSTFGWESADRKAAKKYPGHDNLKLVEYPKKGVLSRRK